MNLNEIDEQIEEIKKELNILNNNELVKKYKLLEYKMAFFSKKRNNFYKIERKNEFSNCNHIWVNYELNSKYCIKCGLHTLFDYLEFINFESLNDDDQIIFEYLNSDFNRKFLDNGEYINIDCDKNIAKSVYERLKNIYSDADEQTIIKYLKAALFNMNNKDTGINKMKSRINRLKVNVKEK